MFTTTPRCSKSYFGCVFFQVDGTIIAPTNSNAWGRGLLQWLDFTKLVGFTIQGNGIIDGRGSVWWQDTKYNDPLDDEEKLLVPLNNTIVSPPMQVISIFTMQFRGFISSKVINSF